MPFKCIEQLWQVVLLSQKRNESLTFADDNDIILDSEALWRSFHNHWSQNGEIWFEKKTQLPPIHAEIG